MTLLRSESELESELRGVGGRGSVGGTDGSGVMTAVMSVNVVPCGVGKDWIVTSDVFGIGICKRLVGLVSDGLLL